MRGGGNRRLRARVFAPICLAAALVLPAFFPADPVPNAPAVSEKHCFYFFWTFCG